MRYRAFISYSHADEKWARWLIRRLEHYRVPAKLVGTTGSKGPLPAKLGKFFRDRDELPSAGNLNSTISAVIENSDALIVICSPNSAQSRWVNAEIDAFRQSGREDNIYSFIVDGDPASREPSVACFPDSLIKPEAEGEPEREPLAADARKLGDGRERAFIKLVAGLLGVGFDSLAQREAQQRNKRMAIITAASLLGMTLAVVLAVTAYIARNDAERRQGQAEDILGFMLGDLRENLTKVGRLDIMRSVDDKATVYFAQLNPRDLSDRALEEQARSLTGIGEVRVNEGNHNEAMIAFREAHARSTALFERDPTNGQRIFDLAQAEYWIGFVAWEQGRYDEAGVWLTKYRDNGIKLAGMDRNNFVWQQEEAYGHTNLAVLDESLGNLEAAKTSLLSLHKLYADWLKTYPDDLQIRADFAAKSSWLGSINLRQGNLQQAKAYFIELTDVFESNVRDEPDNVLWKEQHLHALQLLIDLQFNLGQLDDARKTNQLASQIVQNLANSDPTNSDWRTSLGISKYWQFLLSTDGGNGLINEAADIFRQTNELEPQNESVALWRVTVLLTQARTSLLDGHPEESFSNVSLAHTLIEPFWETEPSERISLRKAKILIAEGKAQLGTGKPELARKNFETALVILKGNSNDEIKFDRLDDLVWVMNALGYENEANVHKQRLENSGFITQKNYP